MPNFICLTVLLLANNEVIVCSRYGATQSVTARLDTVVKQMQNYYKTMTLIYQLCVATHFFSLQLLSSNYKICIELLDAKLRSGESGKISPDLELGCRITCSPSNCSVILWSMAGIKS